MAIVNVDLSEYDAIRKRNSELEEQLKELLEKKTARFIPYTYVRFFHGYAKKRPWIEKEIESITIGKPKKGLCPDKWLDTEFFIIKFK